MNWGQKDAKHQRNRLWTFVLVRLKCAEISDNFRVLYFIKFWLNFTSKTCFEDYYKYWNCIEKNYHDSCCGCGAIFISITATEGVDRMVAPVQVWICINTFQNDFILCKLQKQCLMMLFKWFLTLQIHFFCIFGT